MSHLLLIDASDGLRVLVPTAGALFEALEPVPEPPPPTPQTAPRDLDETDAAYAARLSSLHDLAKKEASASAKTMVTLPITISTTEDCGEHTAQPLLIGVREDLLSIAHRLGL